MQALMINERKNKSSKTFFLTLGLSQVHGICQIHEGCSFYTVVMDTS